MPRSKVLRSTLLASFLAFVSFPLAAAPAPVDVMPLPAEVRVGAGRISLTPQFGITLGAETPRLLAAKARLLERWQARTGFTFVPTTEPAMTVAVAFDTPAPAVPQLGDDEAYELTLAAERSSLHARTDLGVLRGLETLQQLLRFDGQGWFLPTVTIHDQPRFAWRGLLVDPARHWLPVETIRHTLDAMAVVKLNVLHLHLTDDQGFRIETKAQPRLHELGSDGHFYTQEQMRELIVYAANLGIRIVPEFDVPGHATAWLVGHPEIASAPGPYAIERKWGVMNPVLDPTNEKTYTLLDAFFSEMAALFPDAYVHIGGDENNGKHWSANAGIQAFIGQHELKDNGGLHTYFNTRLRGTLEKNHKKLVGWDEILHPDLPKDSVVHSWRGAQGLVAAASAGFPVLLSNGYYLDHALPAAKHYANDPVPADSPLTPAQQKLILGGEACMWGEWVTAETIDSRIWPRAAAVAERLWSPRDVTDVADMYRRLTLVSHRLEEAGALHEKNPAAMLRRFAGDALDGKQLATLETFATAMEAGALGVRARAAAGKITQPSPLTTFADSIKMESDPARVFADTIEAWLFTGGPRDAALATRAAAQLDAWRDASSAVAQEFSSRSPRLAELTDTAKSVAVITALGRNLLAAVTDGKTHDDAWAQAHFAALARAGQPNNLGVTLPMLPSLRLLVAAAVAAPRRDGLSPAEFQAAVEKLAAPPRPAPKKQ